LGMTESGEYKLDKLLELLGDEPNHVSVCDHGAWIGASALQKLDSLWGAERDQVVIFDGESIRTRRGTILYDVHRDKG